MKNVLDDILMNVQWLFESGEIRKKIERIQEEYERNNEPDIDMPFAMGHTFSSMSFMKFEEAVKRNTKDQYENFHQYINRLMFEKDVTQVMLSKRSLIKESTLSRYINGSRDVPEIMVFRMALALRLNVIETETLLRKAGRGFREVYKDGVVMEAIEQGIYDVMKVEAVLRKLTKGVESLFTKKEQEELEFSDEDLEIEII
ncbi:helix-turn-helix domain-containing protein [Bacillus cytotoxicus]|uniref:helix-turn-helix domain-containing protein n=1 Tax=Bacillus cytotoxicus TaxID=580165 RepID=UPI003D7EF56E